LEQLLIDYVTLRQLKQTFKVHVLPFSTAIVSTW